VIFMDHLMPGMDGFQAVQAIKSDAQTATIPLMMYTSQEGELYVSQARALGAVGVLPKTVRPVDVSRVLYQLHLLPERRQQRSALFDARAAAASAAASGPMQLPLAANADVAGETPATRPEATPDAGAAQLAAPAYALSELQTSLRQSLHQVVKDQLAEQRRFMLATFEAFARRLSGEIKEGTPRSAPATLADALPPPPPPRQWWPVLLTALLAVVPAAVLGVLYWQALETNRRFASELEGVRTALETTIPEALANRAAALPAVDPAAAAALGEIGPPAGPLAIEYVPYGETPLANARLERLRGIVATLEGQRYQGRVVVETYVGDFCLSGNAGEGFTVADPGLLAQKCELVGNPFEDSLSPAQRQSVDFANFAASLRQRTAGAIQVEVVNAGRRNPVEYPEQAEGSTAGAWNTVAAQNNRVEFRLAPGA
jgi:CheY-like chemotaxis protein